MNYMKLKALIIKALYFLGLVEKSVATADGIVKRVTRDVLELDEIAQMVRDRDVQLVAKMEKLVDERNANLEEKERAKLISDNIRKTILKGVE